MKAHTSDFKNQIKTMGRELDSKITYTLNGVNVELGKEQLNSITPTYQGALLKSVMKELDIDSNVYIPVGTILNYQFGVKVNGEYEYLNFGNYIVYKAEKQEDTNGYKLICYDKMLYSMKKYDDIIKNANITYPITIRNYINKLATLIGLSFKNASSDFDNYSKEIKKELYYGQDYTLRDVFDELAQVTASTICISDDDMLEIRYITDTNDTIDEEFLKDVNIKFGEKYGPINSIVLSRSAESDNVYLPDETSIAENGLCELKIIDNQIMNWEDRSDYLQDIFTRLNGTYYYLNDYSSTGICYYDLCDRYNVKIGDNTYSCVILNDEINITQGLEENIYTEMPEETQTDYTKADKTDRKINQTYLIVDKQNQEITSVVSTVNKQNEQISIISQQVGELNSKITNIANITSNGETIYANLTLDNINESEPIELKIYPTSENISYLYPRENLYPSNDLYLTTRTLRFKNKKTDEIFDYELPDDLLFYDNDNYDEFYLNYDSQTCQITKKCGYNADGSVYLLDSQVTNTYTYPKIYLTDGDYEISLLGYSNGYLYARLMAANLYTTQFATKVELKSSISQTADEINAEVSKKVGQNEIISRINQTAETITIEANKVNIGGVINAINNNTTTTINGNKITTGSITASQIQTGTITADKVASDVITTNNFSAQTINADNIKAGTLSASSISLKGTQLSPTYSKIGGWTVNDSELSSGNSTIKSNGVVGFYPQVQNGGILALNDGFRCKAPNGVAIYNTHTGYGNSTSVDNGIHLCADVGNLDLMTEHSSYGVNIRSYCSPSSISNAGSRSIRLAAGQNIAMYAVGGYCYAEGNGVASAKIKTDKGSASSKNVKKNLKKFNDKKYDSAINILKNMDLYEYDYKYDLYKDRHQYGFLIDELEKLDRNEFFNFEEEEAIVKGEHLDFNMENKTKKDKTIKVKKYDSDVLDKYLLTVVKALLNKIEILENKIKELEER